MTRTNVNALSFLAILLISVSASTNPVADPIFCKTGNVGLASDKEVAEANALFEKENKPNLVDLVESMTLAHANEYREKELLPFLFEQKVGRYLNKNRKQECQGQIWSNPKCLLDAYWGWNTNISQRVLGLKYHFGAIIFRDSLNKDTKSYFTDNHVLMLERVLNHFPTEYLQLLNNIHLRIHPTKGDVFGGIAIGNRVELGIKFIDKLRPGAFIFPKGWLQVDARVHIGLHEIAHIVDCQWVTINQALPGMTSPASWCEYPRLSQSHEFNRLIQDIIQPRWAWWRVFGEGYGDGIPHEVFAEYFARYILTPAIFRSKSPALYAFFGLVHPLVEI